MVREIEKYPDDFPARLDVVGVSIAYRNRSVLEDVSFQVPQKGRVAVVGPNGAGKSTLFKALVGLIPIAKGKIFIHGLPLGHHKECVAYVPQREEVDWHFPVSVFDVVMMGRFGHVRGLRQPTRIDREVVMESLQSLGMADLAKRSIGDLSGGQQQRVFIARALAQEPHILLMDEPFSGVDVNTQEATLQLLDQLQSTEVTVLVSTHDLEMAMRRFEQVLLLNKRVVAFGNAKEVFSAQALQEAFSGHVLFMNDTVVIDQCCPGEEHEHLS
jgi:ABC-type Mn2+/Zn2+ transport system ATPase subunit